MKKLQNLKAVFNNRSFETFKIDNIEIKTVFVALVVFGVFELFKLFEIYFISNNLELSSIYFNLNEFAHKK